jgi:hypothetical protein
MKKKEAKPNNEKKIKVQKWKINWTSDKIMSSSALFISVISLIALLYQSYLAREENKLIQKQQSASVLPYLNQWFSEYDGNFNLIVGNKGVGPAFIKHVKIVLDSSKIFNNSDDLFKELFKSHKELDTIPYTTSTLISGFVLPANDDIKLIEIANRSNHVTTFKQILNKTDISFSITYEDVYGTQWVLSNSKDEDSSANVPVLISQK